MIRIVALLVALIPSVAFGLGLSLPANAVLQSENVTALTSYELPIGPWSEGAIPTLPTEGELTRQVWRIEANGLTTLQILSPVREQLAADGFDLLFQCRTEVCGGFDFRFGVNVAPPPEMQINLGDFRYLAMRRDGQEGTEHLAIIVSRTSRAGFAQIVRVGPPQATETSIASAASEPLRQDTQIEDRVSGNLPADLEAFGRYVLSDLNFESGSAQLEPGDYPSLQQLADYLLVDPSRKVALVGHTDNAGDLDSNIALARRRAGSALERLIESYGVDRLQLDAQGMGYLAPIASNLTPEGRETNRRVEVILTSTP